MYPLFSTSFLLAFPALFWAWAEACDQHSWCNVTMHTATEEGELLCPYGAPLVALTHQTRSGQESEWYFDCASEGDAQQYHSGSWTHEWNDSVVEQSFHCPPNMYVSGLRMSGRKLLAGACIHLGNYVIDWANCTTRYLFTGTFNHTAKLDRRTVLISVDMYRTLSPFGWGWGVLTSCFTRRVECEVPNIRHGHTHSRGTPNVVTGGHSTGVYRDVGENVTVTCDEGYYLKGGVASALCQQDGAWTSLPVCLKTCDQHSWCNVTMHTATEEGELLCPHGAPLVALTHQTRSGQESEWYFDCASEGDAQQYHSGSWTHEWNDSVVEQSFHCPPNMYVSGLRMSGRKLLAGACIHLGNYVIDWVNCTTRYLLTGTFNSTAKLDRRTVLISVDMYRTRSPFGWGWGVLTSCFTRRVECEVPIIRHGHSHPRGTPNVVTGGHSTGVYRDVGENVTVTCDEGYYLKGGVASALCQQDGAWTSLPVCLKACDQHSWCNVTMHTATEEGELLCPHGAPLVALTHQTRSGQESEWYFDCASEGDAQQYHSGSWTHEWNDSVVERSFHCPPNMYVSGLRMSGRRLLAGACIHLGNYVIDWANCTTRYLLTGIFNSTAKLDRRTVLISVDMYQTLSPYGWGVLTSCFTRRVECEVPIIRHGHSHPRGTPNVVTGGHSTGVYRDVGENITVTCDEGYYLKGGVASALCQQDGAWTSLPVCLRCKLIEDCKSMSCSNTEDSICLSCSSTRYTPFQLSPSRQSCDFAPWVSIHSVVWSRRQATISCTAHGRPAPSIYWELNGEVLSNTLTTVINSTALNVSATVTVNGYYLCRAESALGVDIKLIHLLVD